MVAVVSRWEEPHLVAAYNAYSLRPATMRPYALPRLNSNSRRVRSRAYVSNLSEIHAASPTVRLLPAITSRPVLRIARREKRSLKPYHFPNTARTYSALH
jgi:hypothetical protein